MYFQRKALTPPRFVRPQLLIVNISGKNFLAHTGNFAHYQIDSPLSRIWQKMAVFALFRDRGEFFVIFFTPRNTLIFCDLPRFGGG